ncbi:MBL fold metallo-hydrolase [Natrialba chahannaoensis]|nr:MBL fold metallo-hydrolase [Natrialba chahannaoensis]
MRVSYQNANPKQGNESTLLRFTDGETHACILIDSGGGVDLDRLLGPDEYLNAILLTHAHIDHYRTLGKNVRHSAPIYTSPATAAVLEQSLPEAQKDNDLGNVTAALEAVEPIDGWVSLLDSLDVRPVPAGHTPGGAGFLLRFRDGSGSGATDSTLQPTDQHILVTGDFTTQPCAGYPPLARSYPFDIDAVFLNVPTSDDTVETRNKAVRTILERAYGGSRVVLATSSLTGVQYAVLLAQIATDLDRQLPITLVGQTARVYDALALDIPGIETREVFDQASTVLDHGAITIGGPDDPTTGSAKRLLIEIHDEPADVFVQLTAGSADAVSNANCTTHYFEVSNHPSVDVIDDLVRGLAPKQVIVKHANRYGLRTFQRRYDRCFTWGVDDRNEHVLYEDNEWNAPEWIGEVTARRIRQKQWNAQQTHSFSTPANELSIGRTRVDLQAEGIDVEAIESMFAFPISNPYDEGATGSASQTEHEPNAGEPAAGTREHDTSSGDEATKAIPARVLGDGDGETVLHLLEQTELRPGQVIDISIPDQRIEGESQTAGCQSPPR